MEINNSPGLISFIGTVLQCAITLLTTLLFWLLGRYTVRRHWFLAWTFAWLSLCVALIAILVRYNIVPNFDRAALDNDSEPVVRALYVVYQAGKLVSTALLVMGTAVFAGVRFKGRSLGLAAMGIGLYTAMSIGFSNNLNQIVTWQSAVLIPAFIFCSYRLFTLGPSRRTFGTQLVASFFTVLATLWVLYFLVFTQILRGPSGTNDPFRVFAVNNSFIDALVTMLLAIGMVIMLMEDATGETERVRAERLRDVASSEVRLSSVIRSAIDAIITVDSEHRINLFNPAAEQMFGLRAGAATGASLDDLVHPEQRERLATLLDLPAARGTPLPLAIRHPFTGMRRNGETFPMEFSVSEFFLQGTRSQVLIIRDLTDLTRAEAQRDQLQSQLAHAQRMETVGQLVSGVAHELNNPLAAVLSFSEILLHEPRPEHDRLALSTIREQARRCRSVVRNLLSFVREGPIRRQPVVLHEIVERVTRTFEPELAQFGIQLHLEIPDTLPLLEVDPGGIEQVLTNLVSNAVHAIGTFGEITITATDDGEIVTIVIEDSGPGIPEDVLPRIFEPFFSQGRRSRGTGLGLSVSQGLISLHGGSLRAENRLAPARGARFTFSLPVHPRETIEQTAARASMGSLLAVIPPGKGVRRVLLIEDERSIRAALRRFFERFGWLVEEAEEGSTGLSRLLGPNAEHFDLVISDLKMPDMTGIELHDRLVQENPDLLRRFIFVTGDVASPEAAVFLANTTRPILEKPFELTALAELISQTLSPIPPRQFPPSPS
ncbi:MAG: ATP-binding protein [Gemmatimonadota bacterium]